MNRVSAPGAPPTDRLQIDHLHVLLQSRSIIACYKCISKLARSRPPSASPNSIDHGLQVHLSVHSSSASKCISKLDRSRPPSAALSSLDLGLQVHLQTRSITACKCSSQFTRSRPPSAALSSLISNNSSFRLKHPGVPDGSDGSDGTSYPLTENYTIPVAQATGRVA